MTVGGIAENIGDNKEFAVASASEIDVYFNSSNTSANDTATTKYVDNNVLIKQLQIRTDQAIQIVGYNGIDFTDPISIVANASLIEKFDTPTVFRITIRTLTANTNIKIRCRGRVTS